MKNTIAAMSVSIVAAAALAGTAFAAANDAVVEFSTRGPDRYADGTAVLDGECYALVWTPSGSSGVSVSADGSASGGEMVLVAPVARGGRCPKVFFEVDAGDIASKYRGGTWGVLLLDTRRWGADGTARPAGTVGGRARLVNATGMVSGGDVGVASGATTAAALSAATAGTASSVPSGTPQPRITGMRVDGANVFVTVKGTVPYLQYGLAEGSAPGAVGDSADSATRTGADAPDDEIVLVAPARKGSAFFKVNRR